MRTNIYYWKCDNPLPVEEKLVYNDKYALADITEIVRTFATDFFGRPPVAVKTNGSKGNHYTYLIEYEDRTVFFRADDGKVDDDYMDAEKAVVDLVLARGVPAAGIFQVDTSKTKFPFRYQLMELIPGRCLNEYHQAGTLDTLAVGRQVGKYIAAFHQIKLDGFGFLNTDILRREKRLIGLDRSNQDYFYKRLADHLKYLRDTQFLSAPAVQEIEELFQKNESLLNLQRGSLVHKDLAFWNLIGLPAQVNAIIDWDDAIIGDPVDDLAILKCFYNDDIFNPILDGYREVSPLPDLFYPKLWLYLIRNMLWKAVIRIFMKYFEMKDDFFILNRDNRSSLKQFTYDRLNLGIEELRKA